MKVYSKPATVIEHLFAAAMILQTSGGPGNLPVQGNIGKEDVEGDY